MSGKLQRLRSLLFLSLAHVHKNLLININSIFLGMQRKMIQSVNRPCLAGGFQSTLLSTPDTLNEVRSQRFDVSKEIQMANSPVCFTENVVDTPNIAILIGKR